MESTPHLHHRTHCGHRRGAQTAPAAIGRTSRQPSRKGSVFQGFCPRFAWGKLVPIVTISESLLLRATATDGRILRDRVLCGFCVRTNARKRTFLIATSVCGKQFQMLPYRPLMSAEEASAKAMEVLRECRARRMPSTDFSKKIRPKICSTFRCCERSGSPSSLTSVLPFRFVFHSHSREQPGKTWVSRQVCFPIPEGGC